MSTDMVVLRGRVTPEGTLELPERLALAPGPVEVTVKAVQPVGGEGIVALLARIRAEQQASGHVPRTREEIDEEIRQMHDEWDEQSMTIDRLQEECRRDREGTNPSTEPSP